MILGYLLATLIGLSLGLLGGGGSILTVPILVYVLKMDPKLSIALSLAIVGSTSLIGSITHFRNKNINLSVAMIFAPFAMIGTFLGAKIAAYMSGSTQLILFAVIMILASVFMFKGRKDVGAQQDKKLNYFVIGLQAIAIGIVTGIVGVGGGFLIVPTLVLLTGISMRQSVGTSLLIISLNSLSGFVGYLNQITVPWSFLGTFIIFTSLGIIVGAKLMNKVPQQTLKKVFAIFLIIMGSLILYKNRDKITVTSIAKLEKLESITQDRRIVTPIKNYL